MHVYNELNVSVLSENKFH